MIPQHISTDDMSTELGSDFENPSAMPSPALSSFSSRSTSCNGGEDSSALPDPEVVVLDDNDRGKDVEPLPPLQSFVPIIEALPGLFLEGEDNTFYVNTPLKSGDLKAFVAYARRVEELVLTDVGRNEHPRVSQDVITRLALSQDVKAPFLSSLKRLRIVDVDSEFSYLWFCLTPSLETLDISGIPPARQTTVSTFLDELVSSAPRLAYLTLGPGRLSPSALQTSVRFKHLHELCIADVADALDFPFLQAVAALPDLALFDIDARTAEYTPYTPLVRVAATEGHDAAAPALEGAGHISAGAETEDAFVPFPRLTTLTVTGTVPLMHDLLRRLLPRGIEHLYLTLVRGDVLPIPVFWSPPLLASSELTVEAGKAVENVFGIDNIAAAPLPAEGVVEGSLLPEFQSHTFKRLGKKVPCRGDRSLDDSCTCPTCKEKRRLRFHVFQATHFASTIEYVLDHASPRSVYINRADLSFSSIFTTGTTLLDPPELPPATLRKLLSCPSLTKLQIESWVLPSVNEALLYLPNPSVSPLPMQTLHLPIEEYLHSGVALSTLPSVARIYPRLLDFQARVVQCASALVRDLELSVTDHGLKELSFSGEAPGVIEDMMEIAPYICFLFPHLEKIATYDDHGAEGWKSVYGLVKMCQKVRNTEKMHFQLGVRRKGAKKGGR